MHQCVYNEQNWEIFWKQGEICWRHWERILVGPENWKKKTFQSRSQGWLASYVIMSFHELLWEDGVGEEQGGREGGIKAKGCRGGKEERRREWRRKVRGGTIWKTRNVRRSNKGGQKKAVIKEKEKERVKVEERGGEGLRGPHSQRKDRSRIASSLAEKTTAAGTTQPIWHEKHKIKSNESPQTESWLFTPSVFSLRLLDGELQARPTALTGSNKTYTHVRNPGRVGPTPEHNLNQLFSCSPCMLNQSILTTMRGRGRRKCWWNCSVALA